MLRPEDPRFGEGCRMIALPTQESRRPVVANRIVAGAILSGCVIIGVVVQRMRYDIFVGISAMACLVSFVFCAVFSWNVLATLFGWQVLQPFVRWNPPDLVRRWLPPT